MHYGLTILQVRKLAFEYAKALKCKYPPKWDENKIAGIDWMNGFRKRNSNLSLRKPENTSAARSFAFNATALKEFFGNLKTVYERHRFTADRIFNFDESGITTVLETPKVLAAKSQKQVGQIVSAERGELVTFGGIISANGNTIPPLFVFPRVHFKGHFMEGAPGGSIGAANRSGWINAEIFVDVLTHIQKHTLCSKENPILLLCDNHESHISLEAINYARDNGIVYLSFPPHTTHRLQPLDVGVFGPFKSKLKTAFNNWHITNPGKTVGIYNIPKIAKIAYIESFTAKNIISGFTTPGIWPFNELAFSEDDFAPIQVYTSTETESNIVDENTPPNQSLMTTNLAQEIIDAPHITEPLQSTIAEPSEPSTSTHQALQELNVPVTPEIIRPYPSVERKKKIKKGRQPGKSRIYTDTPEKNRLEDMQKVRELKKIERERRAQAKELKRALFELDSKRPKKKKVKKSLEYSNSESEKSEISLQESSSSGRDIFDEGDDDQFEGEIAIEIRPENIKDNCFILVKFEKKKSVVYYVGKVISHYSRTEFKVSYLRKKSGSSWTFVFPNIEDEQTVYIADIALILSNPKSPSFSTARTSKLFTFPDDLRKFNVQ